MEATLFNYVVTLKCADVPGIVRAMSSSIFTMGGNILENDQFTDPITGLFCQRTRFESKVGDVDLVLSQLTSDLADFRPTLGVRLEDHARRALILVSKRDHCLADLLYLHEQGDLPVDIAAVASNHADCRQLAARYEVPFHQIEFTGAAKQSAEDELRALVASYRVDFVVLARFMQILSPELCAEWSGRAINIHHSFLPSFKGARPYQQAYARGVKIIGATCHFVTSDLDEGPIIEQDVVRISHARQPRDLESLGRDVERNVLSRTVRLIAEDRVALVGNRTIIFSQ
ncbi:MAG: formyltetrahydrofolate deformylase [Acidimicrobiales bacterium]